MVKMLINNRLVLLLTVIVFFMCSDIAQAEGTKQLAPAQADTIQLNINSSNYYDFAKYGSADEQRLYIRIADPTNEKVYLGFSQPRAGIETTSTLINGYFRIMRPDGTVARPAELISGATANLNSWSACQAGPSTIGNPAGGYSPWVFDPTGMPAGDYYIEFNREEEIYSDNSLTIEYFDITVANTSGSPSAIDGRVFAKNWGLAAPPKTPVDPAYQSFSRAFNGAFYVYTNEKYVSKVDFNGSGFQPWAFNISLNQRGTQTTDSPEINRQSLAGGQGNIPEYPIFLNDPDINIYPSGSFGELLNDSTEISGCPAIGYRIKVATTNTGVIDFLLDQDQTSGVGIYDPNTADRLLSFYVDQQTTDTVPGLYIRYVPWDGLDGQGNVVNTINPIPISVGFSQGGYHIPVFDAEYCINGFDTEIVRPAPPVSYTLKHFFDDNQINGGTQQFVGCAPKCHTWNNSNFGNGNTINTWWYAKQEFQVADLPVTQDCGPDTDGDGVADAIDTDWDNDGIPNMAETCNTPFQDEIQIVIKLDNYPEETTWNLKNRAGTIVASGGPYSVHGDLVMETYTGILHGLTFTIDDDYGDGLIGGYYQLIAGSYMEGSTANGAFGSVGTLFVGDGVLAMCTGGQDPTIDNDNDGIVDYKDTDFCTLNAFGICDFLDNDNDGIPSFLDLDNDNDGIPDIIESGAIDTNNDGMVDFPTAGDPSTMLDADNDGLADVADFDSGGSYAYPDTDGDGIVDLFDLDADGDGLADLVEVGGVDADGNGIVDEIAAGGSPDADNNGWVDIYTSNPLVNQALTDPSINTDGDAVPNHLDIDSDNDGITDVLESGNLDGNMDGIADDGTSAGIINDANGDGWDDSHDDGLTNTVADGSSDVNSLPDFSTGAGNDDFDGDGIPNWLDIDADNDGIIDAIEGVCSVGCADQSATLVDANGNGLWDVYEGLTNANATGGTNVGVNPNLDDDDLVDTAPDYLDLNTDEDASLDWIEGYDANMDGNAIDDLLSFATIYNNNSGSTPVPFENSIDTDNDGIPNWMDNLMGPGYTATSIPPYLDPSNAQYWIDLNGNGLADIFDPVQGGTAAPTPNANGGDMDWRDVTTQTALPLSLVFFDVKNVDCTNEISWITEQEHAVEKMFLEKSNDGVNFEKLAAFSAKGNSRNIYEFNDSEIEANSYYRLRIVEFTKAESYSKVVSTKSDCLGASVAIFPNPVIYTTSLNINTKGLKGDLEIKVVDNLGRLIYIDQYKAAVEDNFIQLPTSALSTGLFYLQITNGSKSVTTSFVVK